MDDVSNTPASDSVSQVNVKVVGEVPAEGLAHSYQSLAHAIGEAMGNAAQSGGISQVDSGETPKTKE